MKTVKEWFESVSDIDIRQKLLNNMTDPSKACKTFSLAVSFGFDWETSTEGWHYWDKYFKSIKQEA